jgi:hypothetical protein
MYANAIAQVEPPAVGIHLIWLGPYTWLYSRRGWSIQRREFARQKESIVCDELDSAAIATLRIERDRVSPIGIVRLRDGLWPLPIAAAGETPIPCDVFTLDLNAQRKTAQLTFKGRQAFAVALREGKAVAVDGPRSGSATFELRAIAIDTIVFYVTSPGYVRFCVATPIGDEERDWASATFIVKDLQLPLKELMPALTTPAKEFAEAKSRLLAGETLDQQEFKRLTGALRPGVQRAGPPRPLDQVLLMRNEAAVDFEELSALDPIRMLLSHPKWRRVLGFGWFDKDPTLQVGKTYEYRITGYFPAEDINDKVYGFHSVPAGTPLPAEFFLHDLRLRRPEPVAVARAPGTPSTGLVRITRRGIPLRPKQNPWWVMIPPLDDNSLVVDFPSPVSSIILELHQQHDLRFTARGFGGLATAQQPVPAGERPRLNFPFPARQLRLQGKGFLFAIRIPSGREGLQPRSVVLLPTLLKDTPRPPPPVSASVRNLQEAQPTPLPNDIPANTAPSRPALGFEVKWRPALRDGLVIWPPDADAAPPMDAALFQIEHREELPPAILPAAMLIEEARAPAARARRAAPRLTAELLRAAARVPVAHGQRESLVRAVAAGDTRTVHDLVLATPAPWTPILPEENWTLGDRSRSAPVLQTRIHPGADVMSVFPEVPRPANGESLDLMWADVFDFPQGGHPVNRPVPQPGTYHRYRVRAVDPVGRPSLTWTETNLLRLEKRVPPPVPVGPDQTPGDLLTLPKPSGVQAKVIVRNAPGLTADDVALLGTDANVIVLRWGWHAEQRVQDPFATEFRIYATVKPLDVVSGVVAAISTIGLGVYEVTIQLERRVVADAAKDAPLEAGYPFVIYNHTAGQTITATVGTRVAGADGNLHEPALGRVRIYTHLTPDLTRPPAWSERVAVQAIGVASEYQFVLRNRLTLTPDHPRDSIWVGVSSADAQSYVDDQLPPPDARPGNESAIVPVLCEARYHGRPDFAIPPPLDPVPVLITAEPTDRAIAFSLDLTPYLDGSGLTAGDRVRPERVSAAAVFQAYRATDSHQIMARAIDPRSASETDVEVIVPNPGDRDLMLAALNGASVDALEDRFVVFLAGSHPYGDRLFEPVTREAVPFAAFAETAPPLGERYVYRLRRADAVGHLSAGAAMAKVIVRVPSMTSGAPPAFEQRQAADGPGLLRLRVGPDPSLTHLLAFSQVKPDARAPAGGATVLRIPNRPDTYPAGIRLRAPDRTLLTPQVKLLSDADVAVDADGFRHVQLNFSAAPSAQLQVWACTVTRDGVPSILTGPWGLVMAPAPLPVPDLAATRTGPEVIFAWTWPPGDHAGLDVALERSLDAVSWRRVSPMLTDIVTSYVYTPPAPDNASYRIVVVNPAGRQAAGSPVTTA